MEAFGAVRPVNVALGKGGFTTEWGTVGQGVAFLCVSGSFVSLPAAMNASAAAASSALGIGSWSIATPLEVGSGWNVCVMAETGDESSEAETSGTGGRHVEDVVGFVEVLAFFGIGLFGAVAPIFRTVLGCILLKYDFLACR